MICRRSSRRLAASSKSLRCADAFAQATEPLAVLAAALECRAGCHGAVFVVACATACVSDARAANRLTLRPCFHGCVRPFQEGNLKLGSWQMVLWQPRWVHAETDALCYQKITADERPIGREKRIEFKNVRDIEELEYGEFVLQCKKRDYTFKAPDENKCQVIVHNLRQLRERWRISQQQ